MGAYRAAEELAARLGRPWSARRGFLTTARSLFPRFSAERPVRRCGTRPGQGGGAGAEPGGARAARRGPGRQRAGGRRR
ncbi:hypothetical protein EBN88_13940 [Streptomyces triticirhizae]|uniref:Uncharacterized protein n=1 Tax=Streptomyces triticirhizae TaxID=2483353 RepID=A0A3M2LTE2_9ACTN|nr:hypothetical protein EBN88_13940 [Streptomyces triticirhizae]